MNKTYDVQVTAGRIMAFDGLISVADQAQLHGILRAASYTRSEIAKPETAEFQHWAVDIDLAVTQSLPIFAAADRGLAQFAPDKRYRLYRSYVNVAHFGDALFSHTDCLPGAGELTVLWYLCDRWDPEWGGETLFFDEAMDVRAAIQPRPGRMAVFNGEIPHVGRPPNRNCHASRFTLAMKYERVA